MLSTRHLGTPKPPWVLLSSCDADTLRVVAERQFPRLFVARILGKRCRTKRGLFRAFAEALRFPDYFGGNWDAFEECISDLSWLKANGYLLIVSDAEMLLARNDEDYKTFISIMTEAGKEWAETARRPRAFHLVLATTSSLRTASRRWRMQPTALALSAS
jgi:hypothetical protein